MSSLRTFFIACLALFGAVAPAQAAVQINDVQITNVGTSTFTVVWTTSDVSTPGLDVFSDAQGTVPADNPGREFFPIAEGDVAVVNEADAREARRSLELLAINRKVVVVKITNLSPGTSYYVRPRTFAENGSDNGAGVLPLVEAKTAQFNSLIPDARLLRVRFPNLSGEGMVAVVRGPAGTNPVSMIVGDSADANVALIPLTNLIDAATGTNPLYSAPQEISIQLLGANAPAGSAKKTVDFAAAFHVAKSDIVDVSFASGSGPIFTTQPHDQKSELDGKANFLVVATGTPAPTLKWQRKPAGSNAWSDLANGGVYAGVSTGTLLLSNLTYAMNGDAFRAVATNGTPPDAISEPAVLTVSPLKVTRGTFVLNRRTNTFAQAITVTNVGATPVTGPIRMALDNLSVNTRLTNGAGTTAQSAPAGSPYVQITAANLAAGASATFTLQFAVPATGTITYTTRTLIGSETP